MISLELSIFMTVEKNNNLRAVSSAAGCGARSRRSSRPRAGASRCTRRRASKSNSAGPGWTARTAAVRSCWPTPPRSVRCPAWPGAPHRHCGWFRSTSGPPDRRSDSRSRWTRRGAFSSAFAAGNLLVVGERGTLWILRGRRGENAKRKY